MSLFRIVSLFKEICLELSSTLRLIPYTAPNNIPKPATASEICAISELFFSSLYWFYN